MDLEFTEEQKIFQKAVRDFANKEIAPIADEAEKNERLPVELFQDLGKLGYLCPGYPLEYGGGGLGKIGDCIKAEEISRICSGINTSLATQSGLATYAILTHGTEEQKQKYLALACKGEKIASFGLTEPNAGSDASAIESTAKREGDCYVVNGSKIYITNGEICDFVTVAVSTDRSKGGRGISALIVEKGTPGFGATKVRKLGSHSSATADLFFEDCRVPVENLIGEEGKGLRYMLEALTGARITHSAGSIGLAQAAFEDSLDYAKTRVQFGQPIGKFEAIAFKLSRLATEIEAARALLYRVAWLYDKGENVVKESAMTKLFSSEMVIRATEEAMRIHAGIAYSVDSKIQRHFRDAILRHSTEGTTEIQQLIIARSLEL
ncbi:acyl-CoA dehydrogenase family protein [Chloroflexota bacterium]